MKKISLKIICLSLVLIILIGCMTSCSGSTLINLFPKKMRALAVYNSVNQLPSKTDSYTVESTLNADFQYDGTSYSLKAQDKQKYTGINSNSYTYYEETVSSMEEEGKKSPSVTKMTNGFSDGRMFFSTSTKSGKNVKLYSELSTADYVAHREAIQSNVEFEINLDTCEEMNVVKESDKSWTATYKGFKNEGLTQFEEEISSFKEMLCVDYKISDVIVVAKVDKNLSPISISMDFVFEKTNESSDAPVPALIILTEIKDIDSTEPSNPVDTEDTSWKKVDDLRILDNFQNALTKQLEAENGSFETQITTAVKIFSKQQTSKQTYSGTYSNASTGYEFDIDVTQNNVTSSSIYKDGILTSGTKNGDEIKNVKTEEITEYEAQMTVRSYMDPAIFTVSDVISVSTTDAENGEYMIILDKNNQIVSALKSILGNPTEISAYIEIEYRDGELISYTLKVLMSIDNIYDLTTGALGKSLSYTATCTYSITE